MDIQKEREAFEAATNIYHCIYNADLNYYFSGSKFVGDKAETQVNAGWKAWQAAKAQAVPEGFVLVPIQPNEKTLIKMSWSVALGEDQHGNSVYLSIDEAKQAYEAVIEAQEQAQ